MIFPKHFFAYCYDLFEELDCLSVLSIVPICYCEIVLRPQLIGMIFPKHFPAYCYDVFEELDCLFNLSIVIIYKCELML